MVDCDAPNRQPEDEIRDGCSSRTRSIREISSAIRLDETTTCRPRSPPRTRIPIPDCVEANPGQVIRCRGASEPDLRMPLHGCRLPTQLVESVPEWPTIPPRRTTRGSYFFVADYGAFDPGLGQGASSRSRSSLTFYITGWFTKNGAQMAQGCPGQRPAADATVLRSEDLPDAMFVELLGVGGLCVGLLHFGLRGFPRTHGPPDLCAFDASGRLRRRPSRIASGGLAVRAE